MSADSTNDQDKLERLVRELEPRLTSLRPSERRKLIESLDNRPAFDVLGRAIEQQLRQIDSIGEEPIERLYFFGMEMRYVIDGTALADTHLHWHWENINRAVLAAFIGGFNKDTYDDVFDHVSSMISGMKDARINPEDAGVDEDDTMSASINDPGAGFILEEKGMMRAIA